MYLFIAIFGIVISVLVEETVAKAPQCVDNFKKCGHRNGVLLLLRRRTEIKDCF